MELVLLFVILALVVGAAGAVVAVRSWTWRPVLRRRVLVQTDAEVTFEGVVMQRRGPLLVLADVTVRTTDQARADGLVVIERSRVLWIQVMT